VPGRVPCNLRCQHRIVQNRIAQDRIVVAYGRGGEEARMTTPTSELCPSCFAPLAAGGLPCGACGFRGVEPSARNEGELLLGALLRDRYAIGRVLGRGGFGITYLAWDTRLRRHRAIKEYFPRGVVTREVTRTDVSVVSGQTKLYEIGMEKYLEEARLLAQFEAHPCIVSPLDFFEENQTAYLVMEYLEGETLRAYVARQGGRIPYPTALRVLAPVIEALATVHRAGILHRDVSPDNIFLTTSGEAKLLDFGAARQRLVDSSQSMTVILREHYAPPEQYTKSGRQGSWTDVYAFGATFYMAITGHSPPPAPERLLQDRIEWPSRMGVSMPALAEQALMGALAVRAEERPQQIEELLLSLAGKRVGPSGSLQDTTRSATASLLAELASLTQRARSWLEVAATPPRARAVLLAIGLGVAAGGAAAGLWRWAAGGSAALTEGPTSKTGASLRGSELNPESELEPGTLPESSAPTSSDAVPPESEQSRVVGTPNPEPAPAGDAGLPGLIVRSAFVDDQLFIDDKPMGSTGSTVHRLEPGRHRIRVVKPGYQPFESQVELAAGSPLRTLRAELKVDGVGLRARFDTARQMLSRPDPEAQRAGFSEIVAVAELGYAPAQSEAARVLFAGKGKTVEADDAEALRWLAKAAEQGDVAAQYLLGLRLEFGRLPEGAGDGNPPSPLVPGGRGLLTRLFTNEADFRTLLVQHTTPGDPKELERAFKSHMRAAERDHSGAQERVGYMLASGRGTKRSPNEAFYWLLKAAVAGRTEAQYAIGMAYLLGEGYAANPEAATCWLRVAAQAGHDRAKQELVRMKASEEAPSPIKPTAKVGPACNYAPMAAR
jgi:serine/threonine protein kinase/TPR repeat protein